MQATGVGCLIANDVVDDVLYLLMGGGSFFIGHKSGGETCFRNVNCMTNHAYGVPLHIVPPPQSYVGCLLTLNFSVVVSHF